MDPSTKVGVLAGIGIMSLASWAHAMSNSAVLQDWFPWLRDIFVLVDTVAPFIVFFGAWILFYALLRRPIIATVLAVVLAAILGVLVWL